MIFVGSNVITIIYLFIIIIRIICIFLIVIKEVVYKQIQWWEL